MYTGYLFPVLHKIVAFVSPSSNYNNAPQGRGGGGGIGVKGWRWGGGHFDLCTEGAGKLRKPPVTVIDRDSLTKNRRHSLLEGVNCAFP